MLFALLALTMLVEEPINVSATDLWDAFNKNQAKAEEKYLDRELIITGIVKAVDAEKGFITFKAGGFGVHVDFKHKADVTAVSKDKRLTVRCKCVANPADKVIGVDFINGIKEPD